MIFRTSKAIAITIAEVPNGTTAALSDYRFTNKVEKRIHKKGGEFIHYNFMLTYRRWIGLLVPLSMIIVGVFALFNIIGTEFQKGYCQYDLSKPRSISDVPSLSWYMGFGRDYQALYKPDLYGLLLCFGEHNFFNSNDKVSTDDSPSFRFRS
ncbi:TPA: hypothetical protein ACN337_003368 [Vibrio parahaemolyticus]